MIKTELINKKSICHALIASSSSPDILIPIKAIVEDTHFNENIPYYDLKIIKIYDGIDFMKRHFYDKPFLTRYKGKTKPLCIPNTIKTAAELERWLADSDLRFCVESTFVVKTKIEMVELFNKIQEYLIVQALRSLRSAISRPLYEGPLRIESKVEFGVRIQRAFNDKLTDQESKELIDSI